MSANDFHNGNTLFQSFMNETKDLGNPYVQIKKSLDLANIEFPTTQESALGVAKKSLSHLKQKAELLSKALGGKYKRTECLNLVSNMCFFSSWKVYLSFSESFPSLSTEQRKSSGDSVKLVSTLWNITENRQNEFFSKFIVASAMILSMKTSLGIEEALLVTKKVFTDSKAKSKGDFIDANEVFEIIHNLHREPGKYYLMYCLSQVPSRNGVAVRWGNLENIDVGKFLRKTIFLDTGKTIVNMHVVEAIATTIMASIHSYAEASLAFFISGMFAHEGLANEKTRLINALARDQTRIEVHKVISRLFSGKLTLSVNEYVTRQVGGSGFIDETIFSMHTETNPPKGLIKGSETKLSNGHSIKLFKTADFVSESYQGVGLQGITSLSFDQNGLVSGCLVTSLITNPSGGLKTLGLFCDEIENVSCIEAVVSLGVEKGFRSNLKIARPAFINYLEVSRDYQSIGIGSALVKHAFEFAHRNSFYIDYVFAKVEPLEYSIPPLDDSDQGLIPNYYEAKSRTLDTWGRIVKSVPVLKDGIVPIHSVGYQKNCHGHPNLLMTAMSLFELGS